MPTQIVIVVPMAGLRTQDTLQRVLVTMCLVKKLGLSERLTSIEMYLVSQSLTSCPTLLIRLSEPVRHDPRSVLVTSSLMGSSIHPSLDLSKESTQGLTNTLTTLISALRKKLTYAVNFIKYLC
jgi:hypothetical protein